MIKYLEEVKESIRNSDIIYDVDIPLGFVKEFKSPMKAGLLRNQLKNVYGDLTSVNKNLTSEEVYLKIKKEEEYCLAYTLLFISLTNKIVSIKRVGVILS